MITNLSAAELLSPADRPRLWEQARSLLASSPRASASVKLSCGLCTFAVYRAVIVNHVTAGALVQLSNLSSKPLRAVPAVSARSAVVGWASLTDAERTIAEIVARGLSNREVGRHVYLSAHTVDSHLRQIFCKLAINSRVELARIVGEHHQQLHSEEASLEEPYRRPPGASAKTA